MFLITPSKKRIGFYDFSQTFTQIYGKHSFLFQFDAHLRQSDFNRQIICISTEISGCPQRFHVLTECVLLLYIQIKSSKGDLL